MNRNVFKPALAALSLSVLLAACSKGPEGQAGGHGMGGPMPAMPVTAVTVQAKELPVVFDYTGQTVGSKEVEVRARVGGILEKRLYTEGAAVGAGQTLFELDDKPLKAQAAAAEADVATAQARAAQASREAARLKPLLADKAVSQQEYDNAVSNEQIAAASLLAAKARLQEINLNLGYTRVVAPVSGVVGRALKSEGSLVSQSDSLLATLVQLNPMYVGFGPSENEQSAIDRDVVAGTLKLPKGGAWSVEVRDVEGRVLARGGRLNFTDSRVSNQTGTVEMRAEVPNADGHLKAGQFVRVSLAGAVRPDAITVPQAAVIEGPQGKMVLVTGKDKDGKTIAMPRPVEVGEWARDESGARVWVIKKGLASGDQVILDNLTKLMMRPGAEIAPAAPSAQSAPAAAPAGK
ncbi:efflux RND transporter periplasmic adaptor subunit [Viridibacterium curvum]|uniref:Efflux RND transporter periplasmic adaptor subunit n=1 Tax=Viridibacterium curvum TaxID=1101404 RepID=A0ABP9QUW9_9RHOO